MLPLLPGRLWQRGVCRGGVVGKRWCGVWPAVVARRCSCFLLLLPLLVFLGVRWLPSSRVSHVRKLLSGDCGSLIRHPVSESMGVGHPLPPLPPAETVSLPPLLPKWLVPRRSAVTGARRRRRWPGVGLGTGSRSCLGVPGSFLHFCRACFVIYFFYRVLLAFV
jgi:hypothetical protein